jgi:hypothetical protein
MPPRWLARCFIALGCLVPSTLSAQRTPATAPFPVPFQLPVALGNARLRDSSFVGEAMAYHYEGRRITGLDVYTWPLPIADSLYAARSDSLLKLEVAKFKEAVPVGAQQGWYDKYHIVFDDPHPVAVDGDSLPGYVVGLVFVRRREPFTSFFYIYAVQGMYVKIRLTVPGDGWNTNPALDVPAQLIRAVAPKR